MSIFIRKANINDSKFFYELRTFPLFIPFFYSRDKITLESHSQWFLSKIKSDRHVYLVAELDEVAIGCVRFDPVFYPESFEIGFILHPNFIGQGLSFHMIAKAISFLENILNERKPHIYASVFESNIASLSVLFKVGFTQVSYEEHFSLREHFPERPESILLRLKTQL